MFPSSTTIMLTATPNANSVFAGWSGGVCGGTGVCSGNIDQSYAVVATFAPVVRTLTVTRSGPGAASGVVTSMPAGINCGGTCTANLDHGTVVVLTASGPAFNGWSGGGCSGTGVCVVTLNAATSVTAIFG
jgi:hypothetical protein